ncbi:putative Melatonin receptor type 1A [Hypsibius exemplaris]|uniref:Melatonin receptor type 1A n=1 Tax=Hypsibius exemplaris TaxID=2072580 RepID=A0A1W0WJJ0_HYPEX|nr:putative Melatonin receptor type 1A [Hypsibius exemplaris]
MSSNITKMSYADDSIKNPLEGENGLKYFFVICLALLSVFGTFGNLLVIGTVCVMPVLRTTNNYFIINLSVADFMVTTISMPSNVLGALFGPQFYTTHSTACWITGTFCAMGCISSCWNIAMISANRYILICRYDLYDKVYTKANTVVLCLAVWLIIYLVDMPTHAGWTDTRFSNNFFVCTFNHLHIYTYFYAGVGISIPLGVIFLCYLGIYLKVHRSSLVRRIILNDGQVNAAARKTSLHPPELLLPKPDRRQKILTMSRIFRAKRASNKMFRANVRVARALFRVFLIFLIMWTPMTVVLLLRLGTRIHVAWYLLALLLAHGNSCLNCVIYALALDHFREGYWRVLQFLRSKLLTSTSLNTINSQQPLELLETPLTPSRGDAINFPILLQSVDL